MVFEHREYRRPESPQTTSSDREHICRQRSVTKIPSELHELPVVLLDIIWAKQKKKVPFNNLTIYVLLINIPTSPRTRVQANKHLIITLSLFTEHWRILEILFYIYLLIYEYIYMNFNTYMGNYSNKYIYIYTIRIYIHLYSIALLTITDLRVEFYRMIMIFH